MVSRLTKNIISIDGLKVFKKKDTDFWLACNRQMIGSIRLQALYLFLEKEDRARRKRFEFYVDETINELIYN